MARQKPGQADCLGRNILPQQRAAGGRRIAFVEHQVDGFEDRIEPLGMIGSGGRPKRQIAVAQQTFSAHQPLRDRAFLDEEGARDLADAKAADNLQRQRNACLSGQGWMTG